MTSGTFPLLAPSLFILAAFITPIISYVLLRREHHLLSEAAHRKPLSSVFFTEILLWIAAVLVLGFVMLMLVGFFVYINAHAGAKGAEPVPPIPIIMAASIILFLILIGWLLHLLTKRKLRRSAGGAI